MKLHAMLALTILGLTVAACDGKTETSPEGDSPKTETSGAATDPVADPTTTETPADPPAKSAPDPATSEDGKWDAYTKVLPFVMGPEAGLAAAKKAGKPAMFFYVATW